MMKKFYLLALFFPTIALSQLTLSHNIGDEVIETSMYTCSYGGNRWARSFNLADFGISSASPFVIEDAKVGISEIATWDVTIKFNIYAIDANFPSSFSEANLLGSSQVQEMFYNSNPYILTMHFDTAVLVPAGTQRILVEVEQSAVSPWNDSIAFAAGTATDNGSESWFRPVGPGCGSTFYKSTSELGYPDARFYITALTKGALSTDDLNPQTFGIFPNPVKNAFEIRSQSSMSKVVIFDLLGKIVATIEPKLPQDTVYINLDYLAKGVYAVQVSTEHGVYTKKMLKE